MIAWHTKHEMKLLLIEHGWRFPLLFILRLTQFLYSKLLGPSTFMLDGRHYKYFKHMYNSAFRVERAVEVSIALKELTKADSVLEVGNVLSHYCNHRHDVVDKYDKAEGIINQDIDLYSTNKRYDLIISISTLEDIGLFEPVQDASKLDRVLLHLRSLLSPGGKILATMPIGLNQYLDERIQGGCDWFSSMLFMRRVTKDNKWVQTSKSDALKCLFGHPYPCANAIVIGVYKKPIGSCLSTKSVKMS